MNRPQLCRARQGSRLCVRSPVYLSLGLRSLQLQFLIVNRRKALQRFIRLDLSVYCAMRFILATVLIAFFHIVPYLWKPPGPNLFLRLAEFDTKFTSQVGRLLGDLCKFKVRQGCSQGKTLGGILPITGQPKLSETESSTKSIITPPTCTTTTGWRLQITLVSQKQNNNDKTSGRQKSIEQKVGRASPPPPPSYNAELRYDEKK